MKCRCPKCGFEFFTKGNTIKILERLKKGDAKISDLANELNLSRPSIYYHIKKLRKKGLIKEYFKKIKGRPHFIRLKENERRRIN